MNTEKLTWYIARSGGIVAWCLLALALIWGLLLSSRILGRRTSPAWLLSVHRHVGGLALFFTVVHVAAIMLDDFVDFGFTEVLVPMASEWRPGAVAWGIVGMYLLVAIELTSLAMKWLPKQVWRGIHWSSAALFGVATVHGWQSGSDTGQAFMVATIASIALLAMLTIVRVLQARRQPVVSDRQAMLAELRATQADDPTPGSESVSPAVQPRVAVVDLAALEGDWAIPEPVRAVTSLGPTPQPVTPPTDTTAVVAATAGVAVAERPEPRGPSWDSFGHDDGEEREVGPAPGVWKVRHPDE